MWDRTYGALLCQSKSLATALAQRGIERCGNGADAEVRKAWVGARIYRPSVYTRSVLTGSEISVGSEGRTVDVEEVLERYSERLLQMVSTKLKNSMSASQSR